MHCEGVTMHLTSPLASLAPTLDMGVLAVLARSTRAVGVTQLATSLSASRTGTRAAVERLAAQGLVDVIAVGNTKGYALNRDHVLAPAILQALRAPAEIRSRIHDLVDGWTLRPTRVVLFGSMARGEAEDDSDVDLVVLYEDPRTPDDELWPDQLLELTTAVRRWTGNDCDILAFSSTEWARMRQAREPLALAVEQDSVRVWGATPSDRHDGSAP